MSPDLSLRIADLARNLQSQDDAASIAQVVAEAAKGWVEADIEAGITFVHRRHGAETVAATSDAVRRGDSLQYEYGEGPCLDAAWRERQVYAPDLEQDRRWPRWGPRVASELRIRSMLCTQLFTNENQLGALNLYAEERDAFSPSERDDILALAANGAVAVAAAREVEGLSIAVDRRTTIGKALGIVMQRYDMDDERAFAVLVRLSSQQNRKVYDLAAEIIESRALPDA